MDFHPIQNQSTGDRAAAARGPTDSSLDQAVSLTDRRPEAAVQARLKELVSRSPRVVQAKRMHMLVQKHFDRRGSDGTIQRVALGDAVDRSDGWMHIHDATGDWMAFIKDGTVNILVPKSDFDATIPDEEKINDLGRSDVGCSVCVAADYFGISVKLLIRAIFRSEVRENIDLVKAVMRGGASGSVETLLRNLGLIEIVERFDSYDAMMAELADSTVGYTGALAWEGHVIRASGTADGTSSFWDPQSGASPAAIPKGQPLFLIHFRTGVSPPAPGGSPGAAAAAPAPAPAPAPGSGSGSGSGSGGGAGSGAGSGGASGSGGGGS